MPVPIKKDGDVGDQHGDHDRTLQGGDLETVSEHGRQDSCVYIGLLGESLCAIKSNNRELEGHFNVCERSCQACLAVNSGNHEEL